MFVLALTLVICRGSDLTDRTRLQPLIDNWKQQSHSQVADLKKKATKAMDSTHTYMNGMTGLDSAGVGVATGGADAIPVVGWVAGFVVGMGSSAEAEQFFNTQCRNAYKDAAVKNKIFDNTPFTDMLNRFYDSAAKMTPQNVRAHPRKLGATLGAAPKPKLTLPMARIRAANGDPAHIPTERPAYLTRASRELSEASERAETSVALATDVALPVDEAVIRSALESRPQIIAARAAQVTTGWIPGLGAMINPTIWASMTAWSLYDNNSQIYDVYTKQIDSFYAAMDGAIDDQAQAFYTQYTQMS